MRICWERVEREWCRAINLRLAALRPLAHSLRRTSKSTSRSAQEAAPCYARFLTRHTVRYNSRGYSRTELLKAEIASWLQVGLAFDGWDVRFSLLVTLASLSTSPRLQA